MERETPIKPAEFVLWSSKNGLQHDNVVTNVLKGRGWSTPNRTARAIIDKQIDMMDKAEEKGTFRKNGTLATLVDIKAKDGKLKLLLDTCSYLEYIVHDIWLSKVRQINTNPTRAIVVSSMIETKDGYYVYGVRAKGAQSSTANAMIGTIGGMFNFDEGMNDPFEVFAQEVGEELGLTPEDIEKTSLVAITEHLRFKRILFAFNSKSNLTKEEIVRKFENTANDEHTGLIFIEKGKVQLEELANEGFDLTPAAKVNIAYAQ